MTNPILRALLSLGRALLAAVLLALPANAGDPSPDVAAIVEQLHADSLLERVAHLVAFGTRRWDQPGCREAQESIEATFGSLPFDAIEVQDFDAGADNVVAVLRGALRPERVHVLGAHYDSISSQGPTAPAPGADDNASGTAALLEIARVVAQSGLRPAETVMFAAFCAEEPGRVGSRAFVEALLARDDGTVVDMIALDVIGYAKPGARVDLSVSSSTLTPEILDLIETLRVTAAAYLPDWPFEGGAGCG